VTRPGITSVSNARLKTIRRLRRRGADGVFLVEGCRGLVHALESGARVRELYVARALFLGESERRLVERAALAGVDVYDLGDDAFRSIAGRARPDGLLAVVERFPTSLDDLRLPLEPLLLVAEGIERPGNLGTIVRTGCGAGVDAVLVCDGSTSVFHPDTVQGSVGALFRVPLAEARAASALPWLRSRGVRIVVASPHADRPYWEAEYAGPVAVVVGSERHGVSARFEAAADASVRIPLELGVDSLNVAVATGVVLFEAARRRGYAASATEVESAWRTAASSSRGWKGLRMSSAPTTEPSVSGA
jgi:RNA methyltransferase, TrmH family